MRLILEFMAVLVGKMRLWGRRCVDFVVVICRRWWGDCVEFVAMNWGKRWTNEGGYIGFEMSRKKA